MTDNKKLALGLAAIGFYVFRVRLSSDGTKTPWVEGGRGHLDATRDPYLIDEEWTKTPNARVGVHCCLLYTSPSPRDGLLSRMPSSA